MPTPKYGSQDLRRFRQGRAYVTGLRKNCVRIVLPDGEETALCTVTYSYLMNDALQQLVAEAIAKNWNYHLG